MQFLDHNQQLIRGQVSRHQMPGEILNHSPLSLLSLFSKLLLPKSFLDSNMTKIFFTEAIILLGERDLAAYSLTATDRVKSVQQGP